MRFPFWGGLGGVAALLGQAMAALFGLIVLAAVVSVAVLLARYLLVITREAQLRVLDKDPGWTFGRGVRSVFPSPTPAPPPSTGYRPTPDYGSPQRGTADAPATVLPSPAPVAGDADDDVISESPDIETPAPRSASRSVAAQQREAGDTTATGAAPVGGSAPRARAPRTPRSAATGTSSTPRAPRATGARRSTSAPRATRPPQDEGGSTED